MIWNCDGEIKEIKFNYSSVFDEYCCCVGGYIYVYEKGLRNIGSWYWTREGYSLNSAEWVKPYV